MRVHLEQENTQEREEKFLQLREEYETTTRPNVETWQKK